jgi:hypothetical protein
VATERNRKHILVPFAPKTEGYTSHRRGGGKKPPPPESRPAHAKALKASLEEAAMAERRKRDASEIAVHGAEKGLYLEFESRPGIELNHSKFESRSKGIELVAVTESEVKTEDGPETIQRATVFVPDGQLGHYYDRLEKYALETPKKKGERRHEDMLDRVAGVGPARLRDLWTDAPEAYPEEDVEIWWEVWLRREDSRELERFLEFADAADISVGERRLVFDDRLVLLARSTPRRLAQSVVVLGDVAEVRKAKEAAAFFVDIPVKEQAEWLRDLRERSTEAPGDAPAVCVLDTGVSRHHPLLEPSLAAEDCHCVEPSWGPQDDGGGRWMEGHGTEMAGLALWGDLTPVLASSSVVEFRHLLESVKILPPGGQDPNPPELYGAITAQATSLPEIQAPRRRRCFSMAVTSPDDRDRGKPSSWSAAIDALAAGRMFDPSTKELAYLEDGSRRKERLFLISAGNVSRNEVEHLDWSETEAVHDPAQAWNALTVGACTERSMIRDPTLDGWEPVAPPGELSPYSTTSVLFDSQWPIKPEVVFEGGNTCHDGRGEPSPGVADLSLLSTHYRPAEKLFVPSWATSAATAQVARIAAHISAEYPDYWPETIRALIVHSAEWTSAMRNHLSAASGKRAREQLVRRYGFGIPNLVRALRSADDALTLVVQSTLQPFSKSGAMHQMHLHELPWPREVLASLGNAPVELRVTLSYFIEPNPGRRGWKQRHQYASHGLRFAMRQPAESIDDFRKRLNKRALDEGEKKPKSSDPVQWYLGEQQRNKGSLHSDIWSDGTAADLAERGMIGIYPVGGWWKERKTPRMTRYALVISLKTSASDVDLWTPVATEVGVPAEVAAIEI